MSKNKRKILIITERRADFSRFKPIISLIKKSKKLDYALVVSGIHLLNSHGLTINEILKEKFKIYKKINMFDEKTEDSPERMVKGLGKVFLEIPLIINNYKPDIVLTGFDIGANFALTVAGAHMNIPVFHIQGGEVTGSIDESLRHAMSKFSHIHLVANYDAKKRLIKMGEDPKTIYNVGCPSLDALRLENFHTKDYIFNKFGINLLDKYFLLIQHPVTTEEKKSSKQIRETIIALKKINLPTLIILPNNDLGYRKIVDEIKNSHFKWTKSLSLKEYKTLLSNCTALIGNSSSGIHEASTFKVPVINIGTRQQGRLKPKNVISTDYTSKEILNAVNFCLNNKKFKKKIKSIKNPYGDGHSAEKIVKILENLDTKKINIQKINTY